MRKLYITPVIAALLAVPALAQTAPSAVDARLAAIEARLAVLEAKSAGSSAAAPSAVPSSPAPAGKDKLVPGMRIALYPVAKDLSISNDATDELGNFDLPAGTWPVKLTAHTAHGISYGLNAAYVVDMTYSAKEAGTYLVSYQVERTELGPAACQVTVFLEGEQIVGDRTPRIFSINLHGGAPYQPAPFKAALDKPGDYKLRYVFACEDQHFSWTPMVKAPSDSGLHGFRADEVRHPATVTAKK